MLMSVNTTCTIVRPIATAVGSYICTSDRKYRLEQQWIQVNMNHRFPNCSGTKWYIKQQHKDMNPRSSYLFC